MPQRVYHEVCGHPQQRPELVVLVVERGNEEGKSRIAREHRSSLEAFRRTSISRTRSVRLRLRVAFFDFPPAMWMYPNFEPSAGSRRTFDQASAHASPGLAPVSSMSRATSLSGCGAMWRYWFSNS